MNLKNIFSTIFVLMIIFIIFECSRADLPNKPDPKPDPIPCEPVPCEVVRVDGVWDVTWVQDPSANAYAIFQNDVAIFDTTTISGIFKDLSVRIRGNFKQGDIVETVASGSRASLRVKFVEISK